MADWHGMAETDDRATHDPLGVCACCDAVATPS
jgi:hypothetical protein